MIIGAGRCHRGITYGISLDSNRKAGFRMNRKMRSTTNAYKRPWLNRSTKKKIVLLLPVLVLILVLSVYPVIRGIILGFCRYKVGKKIRFNGFDNYIGIYETGFLGTSFRNIGAMMLVSVIFIYILGLVLALLLNSNIPLRPLWRTLLIIAWAVPPVAKCAMWNEIFDPIRGYMNYFLKWLGVIETNISWTGDARYASIPLIVCFIWGCVPFLTLSLLSTLQQIPSDITEAALLDGATPFQHFRYITLPYLNQTTGICMSLIFVWIMNDYPTQSVLTGGGPGTATLTPILEAYKQGFKYGNFGFASAYGNMMIVAIGFIVFLYLKFINANDKGVN